MKNRKIVQIVTTISLIFIVIFSGSPKIAYNHLETQETFEDIVTLSGTIIARVYEEYLGGVSPIINISENQTLEFNATLTENNTYLVNSLLKIDVEIFGNTSAEYLLGRYLLASILIIREDEDLFSDEFLSGDAILEKFLRSVHRIDVLSKDEKQIEIPLEYETSRPFEDVTMNIFLVGTPGFLLSNGIHIFDYNQIKLELVYDNSTKTDSVPPFTVCELEEEFLE